VHQRQNRGQISIVCIDDFSISVSSPNVVGEEVAEEFIVNAVVEEMDVDPDERLKVIFA
jgi:hypothetical protein